MTNSPTSWPWPLHYDSLCINTAATPPALTTYWMYPEDSIPVTYQYQLSDAAGDTVTSPTATAHFSVQGPTGATLTTTTTQVSIGLSPLEMGLFAPPCKSGITFTASLSPPSITQ